MGFQGMLGHEFVSVAEHAPKSFRTYIGKQVVGEINAAGCVFPPWAM